jgi:hypothetical protein
MKLLAFLLLTAPLLVNAQTTIDVADNTMKVSGFATETIYYAFAEGDKIIFNFEEANGKELKEIEMRELDGGARFMDYKAKRVENKTVEIFKTGIYTFRFSNNALGGRVYVGFPLKGFQQAIKPNSLILMCIGGPKPIPLTRPKRSAIWLGAY